MGESMSRWSNDSPSLDEGESGMHEDHHLKSEDFVNHYRFGKKAAYALMTGITISLVMSFVSAYQANSVSNIMEKESGLEAIDIQILGRCLPNCYYEDIYSMQSISAPLVAAEEIILQSYLSEASTTRRLDLVDRETEKEISDIVGEHRLELSKNLNADDVTHQNHMYMISHFLNRSKENINARREDVSKICDDGLGKGTCKTRAKDVERSLSIIYDKVDRMKNSIMSIASSYEG